MAEAPSTAAVPRSFGPTQTNSREKDVRTSNIIAAKSLADAARTSLGPKGMDKMIVPASGDVLITNDGATILKSMEVGHPAGKMLVELSKAQDIEAGDGTTSVVVVAGSLLNASLQLLAKGIHPSIIAESFLAAGRKALEVIRTMAVRVDLSDREALLKCVVTSLASKLVSQYSDILAPVAVDSVLRVIDPKVDTNVDLKNIKIVKKLGGTIEDTELVEGLVFTQHATHAAGGPSRVVNAKIGLIQFCLSAPKTNMESNVVLSDYQAMDRVLKEERKYLINLVNKIAKTGCNVLLIQKSILRDATSDLSLHFLAQKKILVIRDIERDDIEFISKTLSCIPIASIEGFVPEKLGTAKLVEEVNTSDGRFVKVTGVPANGKTVTVLVRGSSKLALDEAERSLHDAHCVVRSLVKERSLIAGGGAPETEISLQLVNYAKTLSGMESYCMRAYAEAFEVIPYTLAENAGLNPISLVTELRNRHAKGETTAGINIRKAEVSNMLEENVIQPLLVSTSIINLATETTAMILKIDDIVPTNRL